MRIAVNTRFLLPSKMEGFGRFTYEVVKRMVENNPQHEFIFFFDRPYDASYVFGENVTPIVLSPPARHPILFITWFELAVFRALKKYRADVFFSPDGYLSLRSKIPQVGVIHDINFEHYPKDIPFVPRTYLRYFFPKFAKKGAKLITVSEYSKQDIVHTYGIEASNIQVAWNGVSEVFTPVNEEQKQATRNFYSNGNPYFLFVGALHPRKNLKRLVAAYTDYRSKGFTNFDLLIVGESMWKNERFHQHIPQSIKQSIHFTGYLPLTDLASVTAAASALTYVPYFEGFGIPLAEAMKCGVPLISGNLTSLPEVAGEAALYCDPFDVEDITKQLIHFTENPALQAELTKKSVERGTLFSWDESARICWDVVAEAAGQV
jgi:glycosyltransferase involved in cell wall biosynthesis